MSICVCLCVRVCSGRTRCILYHHTRWGMYMLIYANTYTRTPTLYLFRFLCRPLVLFLFRPLSIHSYGWYIHISINYNHCQNCKLELQIELYQKTGIRAWRLFACRPKFKESSGFLTSLLDQPVKRWVSPFLGVVINRLPRQKGFGRVRPLRGEKEEYDTKSSLISAEEGGEEGERGWRERAEEIEKLWVRSVSLRMSLMTRVQRQGRGRRNPGKIYINRQNSRTQETPNVWFGRPLLDLLARYKSARFVAKQSLFSWAFYFPKFRKIMKNCLSMCTVLIFKALCRFSSCSDNRTLVQWYSNIWFTCVWLIHVTLAASGVTHVYETT